MAKKKPIVLKKIKAPVKKELDIFEERFRESMRSQVPLLDKITWYIVQRKGKQVRPMMVLLAAQVFGSISEATYTGASMIELLHTATLVHDDVVDDANERRGFFSVNALWKNKIAVLVGDFLLSQGILMTVRTQQYRFLHIISDTLQSMAEGELLQLQKTRKLNLDEAIYFEIIRQKTATLIASACAIGAASTSDTEEDIQAMRLFGEKAGIAFQIRDDLFDYGDEDVGKPLGIDIKERKVTLPLIHTLNNAKPAKRRKLINIIKNHNDKPEKVAELIQVVRESGGLDYAKTAMYRFREEARSILMKFPDSTARQSLNDLLDFVTERKK